MTTYDFIAANKRKTVMLIAVFSALVIALGYVIDQIFDGGGVILAFALIYSFCSALVSYYAGDKVALSVSGAQPVTEGTNQHLVRMVENICISQGMPMPAVYVMPDDSINAFATGRDPQHASISVTTGALAKLKDDELQGVLAHELSHVKNYDIRVMTIVVVLIGVISVIASMVFRFGFLGRRRGNRNGGDATIIFAVVGIALMIFAPIVAQLIKLAVSRRREYLADASGALITRYPDGLIRALKKIQAENLPMAHASAATAHMFLANPFNGKFFSKLLSTHPPIEDRIAALEKMAGPAL
jgi:heat shock protein HtpX